MHRLVERLDRYHLGELVRNKMAKEILFKGKNEEEITLHTMTNVDKSPEHFTFDPKEQFAVVKQARANKEQLMAVYHSHPETPARLSEEDLMLFNDPNMVYIIVSFKENEPDIKGYSVNKPNKDEIEVKRITLEIKEK